MPKKEAPAEASRVSRVLLAGDSFEAARFLRHTHIYIYLYVYDYIYLFIYYLFIYIYVYVYIFIIYIYRYMLKDVESERYVAALQRKFCKQFKA
jgi:hypothetical protein